MIKIDNPRPYAVAGAAVAAIAITALIVSGRGEDPHKVILESFGQEVADDCEDELEDFEEACAADQPLCDLVEEHRDCLLRNGVSLEAVARHDLFCSFGEASSHPEGVPDYKLRYACSEPDVDGFDFED